MPNYKKLSRRALSLILALVMALSLAACSNREPEDASSASSASRPALELSIPAPEVSVSEEVPEDYPDFTAQIEEASAINSDTVGWLYIPGTTINDVVVCLQDPMDYNQFYERRDLYKKDKFEGIYFADCRNTFDGTVEGMSQNTTIYGHAIELPDDPNGNLFSQLKKWWEEDFARETPYIYFTVGDKQLVWEVFAAYYSKESFDYINPMNGWAADNSTVLTKAAAQELIDGMIARSEYIYNDVEVTAEDRILTLSTCVYHLSNNVYPNEYRWVISAKLVQDGNFKEEADITVNENPASP